jgi:hypothetical protein
MQQHLARPLQIQAQLTHSTGGNLCRGLVLLSLVLVLSALTLWPSRHSTATHAAQAFDAAATVTALVQTRAAILAIVTQTPDIAGISDGSSVERNEALIEVSVAGLNVRSGPGTNYAVTGSANNGQQFQILGQAYNCEWLQIGETGSAQPRLIGWISGAAQYVAYRTSCDAIAAAAIPATPTAAPIPTATPKPPQPSNSAAQGCYIVRNELGFAVSITLTGPNGWQDTLQLDAGVEREYCAPAGTYQYTLKAPGSPASIQGSLTVKAGERLLLPLKFGS